MQDHEKSVAPVSLKAIKSLFGEPFSKIYSLFTCSYCGALAIQEIQSKQVNWVSNFFSFSLTPRALGYIVSEVYPPYSSKHAQRLDALPFLLDTAQFVKEQLTEDADITTKHA